MGINTTQAQRQRQLAEDLANKLALEPQFAADLRRLFREINVDYRAQLGATGRVIQASEYTTDMVGTLRRHYRRTFRRFSGQLRRQIKTVFGRETKGLNDDIQAANQAFIITETEQRADAIIATTQRQLDDDATEARQRFVEDNPTQSITEETALAVIALSASRDFARLIPFRSDLISTTEVQNAAEQAKLIEALQINESGVANVTDKQWMTVLDERTRLSHVDADGQRQDIEQPFFVQNELLKRPGDTSLGASLGNIINCRCSSVTIIA